LGAPRRAAPDAGRPTERGVVSSSIPGQVVEDGGRHTQQRGLDVA
jgi:hypothetical protein